MWLLLANVLIYDLHYGEEVVLLYIHIRNHLFVLFFQNVSLFADGRGLRHKYFKDYKDYLGKWGNANHENLHNNEIRKAIYLTR